MNTPGPTGAGSGGAGATRHRIAVIPGDGIGNEVVPEGVKVLERAGALFGFDLEWEIFPWGCERYAATGVLLPDDGIEQLRSFDAIFLGAVGWPGVPDHVSLWGLLLPIRRAFDLYVNLRPVKLLDGVSSPLTGRGPNDIDLLIVRENTEGEYSQRGGRSFIGTEREVVVQENVFTRKGVDRIMRYAFERAANRPKRHLTSATKSNGLFHSMPYWDERFASISSDYPQVRTDQYHIDALVATMVRAPDRFDVIVGSNLFGDILSDLAPALAGSLGIAPSANLNPEGNTPSMFEPVHGSAPDIAGKGLANPIGQIWAGALMLDHLGYPEAAHAIEAAIARTLADGGPRTSDLGGTATTQEVGDAIRGAIQVPVLITQA